MTAERNDLLEIVAALQTLKEMLIQYRQFDDFDWKKLDMKQRRWVYSPTQLQLTKGLETHLAGLMKSLQQFPKSLEKNRADAIADARKLVRKIWHICSDSIEAAEDMAPDAAFSTRDGAWQEIDANHYEGITEAICDLEEAADHPTPTAQPEPQMETRRQRTQRRDKWLKAFWRKNKAPRSNDWAVVAKKLANEPAFAEFIPTELTAPAERHKWIKKTLINANTKPT